MNPTAALLSLALSTALAAAPKPRKPGIRPADFVSVEDGDLPVILCATHGGLQAVPGLAHRTSGILTTDIHTAELAAAVQARLQALTGRKARRITFLARRAFVDVNRPAGEAYEAKAAAPLYAAFHEALGAAAKAASDQGSRAALLLDLHGHSGDAGKVFRGTKAGRTADLKDLAAPDGFLATLASHGLALEPGQPLAPEHPRYDGGYIVQTYGNPTPAGITAVQLEFGVGFRRTPWDLEASADKVAQAVVAHLRNHGFLDVLAPKKAPQAK